MATSSRMLVLLSLLQSRRDWPGPTLADRLDISERTVRRDVDRLRELGYRIRAIKGPDGGYRLDAGSELPPLLFDDEQAVVLAVALQSVAVAGLEDAAHRALTTVRQVMPARLRQRIDAVQVTPVSSAPAAPVEAVATIGGAIHASEVVRFDYRSALRRVEPHHLVTRSGLWYLVGWDLDRDDWRIFRVDRLALRTHTGGRFTPRELPDVAAFVSASFKGSTGADAWPCVGEVIVSAPLSEIEPYIDGTAESVGERTRVVLGSWSWVGLAARFGQFDAELEVVGPPALADAFARLARRYLSA